MHPMLLSARARHLLGLVCALASTVVAPAAGQPASKDLPRVGVLAWGPCGSDYLMTPSGPFLEGLREIGQVPGKTFLLECRSANGGYAGQRKAAHELAGVPVDVIVSNSEPGAHAARATTTAIPIVSIISGDPVASGLAKSLAAPGGNVTGVSYYATELTAKRLELLIELLPRLKKLAVLANPDVSYLPFEQDTAARGAPLRHQRDRLSCQAGVRSRCGVLSDRGRPSRGHLRAS